VGEDGSTISSSYSKLTDMNNVIRAARKIAKQPVLLALSLVSRYKRYTLHGNFSVSGQLEHLFEYYEPETTKFFKKHIKKGMTVVDAGANDGYFTRIFSRLVGKEGKVYAFEPDQEAFLNLQKNTAHLPNVTIFPYAVSDEDGEATWYHVKTAYENHSLLPYDQADPKKQVEVRKVRIVTLDSIIPEKIDAMKLDVEGVEDRVFRGMKRHLTESPWVVFEYTQGYLEPLIAELKQTGHLYSLSHSGEPQAFSDAHYIQSGRKADPNSPTPGNLTNLAYRP
jgi:FkbM family methyltransferase